MTEPSPKTAYRNFCRDGRQLPLFHQPWWLDATCGAGNWEAAVAKNEETGRVEGALPYCLRSRYGVRMAGLPPLTPFLGPLLFPPEGLNTHRRRSFEERVIRKLLGQLPNLPIVRLKLYYDMQNWLPFREAGFEQTTRYSYRIPGLADTDRTWQGFHPKLRNKISHAARYCTIQQVEDAEPVFLLYGQRFQQKGQGVPVTWQWFACLDQALQERQARAAFLCLDKKGRPLAGAYIAWDDRSSYLLLTGFDGNANIRGAAALAVWESIRFVAGRGLIYDFEGSMLPGVERFFREFGGELCPYHRLVKYRNRMWEVLFHTIIK